MKEVTTELKISVTMIDECDDDDRIVKAIETDRTEEMKSRFAKAVTNSLGAAKAEVLKVKHFILDAEKDKKELITEVKMAITMILKLDEYDANELVINCRKEEYKRKLANCFKEILTLDKVDILSIKNFMMDLEDGER